MLNACICMKWQLGRSLIFICMREDMPRIAAVYNWLIVKL